MSKAWFDQWAKYMQLKLSPRYSPSDPGLLPGAKLTDTYSDINPEDYPGPISNQNLLLQPEENVLLDPDSAKEAMCLPIRSGLHENIDFIVVPQNLWEIWKRAYDGVDIRRGPKGPSDCPSLRLVMLFWPQEKAWVPTGSQITYMDKSARVMDLINKCMRICSELVRTDRFSSTYFMQRVWLARRNVLDVQRELEQSVRNELDGRLLADTEPLAGLRLDEDNVTLVVEIAPCSGQFVLKEAPTARKPISHKNGEGIHAAGSSVAATKAGLEYIRTPLEDCGVPSYSKRGCTGLMNLRNTCYMNAALQCLSNCVELTKYFLLERHVEDLGGKKSELVMEYAKLIRSLWVDYRGKVAPYDFKDAVERRMEQFRGYAQQDSQEFVLCLLDALHEDLNRAKTAALPLPALSGEGAEQWRTYHERNDSVVLDLFCGQLRSSIYCPECEKSATTYDPFTVISVPIPQSISLTVTYIPLNPDARPAKCHIQVQDGTRFDEIRGKLAAALEITTLTELFYAAVKEGQIVHRIPGTTTCVEIPAGSEVFAFGCVPEGLEAMIDSNEEKKNIEPPYMLEVRITATIRPYTYYGPKQVTAPYPLILPMPLNTTLKELRLAIFSRIFRYAKHTAKEKTVSDTYQQLFLSSVQPPYTIQLVSTKPSTARIVVCAFCKGWHEGDCDLKGDDDRLSRLVEVARGQLKQELVLRLAFLPNSYSTAIDVEGMLRDMDLSGAATGWKDNTTRHEERKIDIYDCLNAFKKEEQLDQKNLWICTNCRKEVKAISHMTICRPPPILILYLKRFRHKQSAYLPTDRKIEDFVTYPLKGLDISSYMSEPDPRLAKYNLFAVTHHYGSLLGGHYVAVCKIAGKNDWTMFDDSLVIPAREQNVVAKSGYVLYYRRADIEQESA